MFMPNYSLNFVCYDSCRPKIIQIPSFFSLLCVSIALLNNSVCYRPWHIAPYRSSSVEQVISPAKKAGFSRRSPQRIVLADYGRAPLFTAHVSVQDSADRITFLFTRALCSLLSAPLSCGLYSWKTSGLSTGSFFFELLPFLLNWWWSSDRLLYVVVSLQKAVHQNYQYYHYSQLPDAAHVRSLIQARRNSKSLLSMTKKCSVATPLSIGLIQ